MVVVFTTTEINHLIAYFAVGAATRSSLAVLFALFPS